MAVSVESTSTVAEALFVFHTWDKDKFGLPATHRNLIKDFCRRKRNVIKVYATTLDLRLSEAQEKDANDIGVHLIVAERNKWANEKQDPAVLRWLLDHKVHYQRLDELKNVKYVIGYTPETHSAAADIREKLFPDADLVLINCSTASKENGDEFDYKMLDAASEADLLFSLGPLTHKHFEIEYRAERNGKRLCDIPHREIAPIPNVSCKWANIPKDITEPVLFTYGRIDDEEALKRCGPIAAAIGNFSSAWKKHVRGKVTWKIQGISEVMEKRSREFFDDSLKNGNTKLQPYFNTSIDKLTTHLFQSHLCIPLPSTDQSHFDGIEAMSSAVPLVSIEDTHLAEFIGKYLKEYMDSCIVEKTEGHLTNHIQRVFSNIPLAFEKAERLRKTYISSKQTQNTYEEFAALLTPSQNERPSEDNTAERPLEVTFSLPEDAYRRYRQSEVQHTNAERVSRQDAEWSDLVSLFAKVIDTILESEERCQQVHHVIKDKCGSVRISFMKKESLVVTLDVPRLVNLYRLERTTKSGSLAEAMEPLLVTDEMKAKAKRAGIPGHLMKLQVTYNQATFQAIRRFLIKRISITLSFFIGSQHQSCSCLIYITNGYSGHFIRTPR
ncbi:uncharacterized protein [Ptychodera flava]|uniref:uncharacterized protein n=1 Tax=Ptychodera flava TaxID=63121 RepID=UPI00396A2C2D